MEMPSKLDGWNMPDTIEVQDGYDMTSIPDITRRNFNRLIEEHNKLVGVIEVICDRLGISEGE